MNKKLIILALILGMAGIANAVGEPVCLVISPTDAGVNDPVTVSAYDGSDNWVDLRDYTVLEICFDDGLCIFSGGGIDVSSGDGVFTLTSAILAGYKFDCDFWNSSPPPDSTWFTLVNPSEGDPAFESIAEAIAAGGDCTLPTDTNPPTPDPMTWATAPTGLTTTSITMTATTASDQSGVEYQFDETSGNPGGTDSGWQDETSYTDGGLDSSPTQYCYRVQARDKSVNQNTGGWSSPDACSETAAAGETLYNGIVLPQTWPPEYGPVQYEPMPVPYLDDPPEVVLIDVGRQLFVDDFLIDTTDMTQTFHQVDYYTAGNPVITSTTVEELGSEGGSKMAGPFSGGSWYDPDDNLYKMWYRGGMAGIYGIDSQLYATSTDGKNWDRPNLDVNPVGLLENFTCTPSNPSANDQVTIAAFDEYDQQVDLGDYDVVEFCWGNGAVCIATGGAGITIDGNGGAVFTCTQAMLNEVPNIDFLAYKETAPPNTELFKLPFPFDPIARAGNSVYPFSGEDVVSRDSMSVLLDHNAAASERFKWFATEFPGGGAQLTYRNSPDGIHWSAPQSSVSIWGDRTTVFYNPFRDVWVCSQRTETIDGERNRSYVEGTSAADLMSNVTYNEGPTATPPSVHWVGADYLDPHHTDPLWDHIEPQLYTLDCMPYESVMLGQFSIWTGPYNADCGIYMVPKRCDLLLGFSRDGFHWDRPDRTRFISSTWDEQSWRMGNVQSVVGSPLVVGDELHFYFNARPKPVDTDWDSNYQAGLATLRRDGFASMDASGTKTLTTTPVKFTNGKYLFVNTDCPSGSLKVEVLDQNSQVIAPFTLANCDTISADTTSTQVTWGGSNDLSALQGQATRFRFTLDDGSLYAFWVSPDASGASYGYVGGGGPGFTGPTDTVGQQEDDTTPPAPDPMTWASVPTADDQDSISMTATTATDPSGVSYYFDEITGNPGGDDSVWQSGTSYNDDGLNSETQYTYTVTARDNSINHNETAASTDESATTEAGPAFADNFESATDWSNNWTAYGAWQRVTARSYDGSYSAEIDGNVTDSALVSAAIDVAGKTDATVTFAWYIEGGVDAGEYLRFDVDAGSGWVQMASLDGNVDPEGVWNNESIPVDVSAASTMYIRFRGKMSGSNEDAYLDVVEVTTVAGVPDTDPPTPDPMTWASDPCAISQSAISMTATTATDPSGVQYFFDETSGNTGGSDSVWQADPGYTDDGLVASTQYSYQVKARDNSANQNETGWSTPLAYATTPAGCSATDMHIESVVCAEVACGGPNKNGQATVTIYDDCGDPVQNALVDGTFSGAFNETFYDVQTDQNGVAVFTTAGCVKKPSFSFTVDDVTDTLPHDPSDDLATGCSG